MTDFWIATFEESDYDYSDFAVLGIFTTLEAAMASCQAAADDSAKQRGGKPCTLNWTTPSIPTPDARPIHSAIGPKPKHAYYAVTTITPDQPTWSAP